MSYAAGIEAKQIKVTASNGIDMDQSRFYGPDNNTNTVVSGHISKK